MWIIILGRPGQGTVPPTDETRSFAFARDALDHLEALRQSQAACARMASAVVEVGLIHRVEQNGAQLKARFQLQKGHPLDVLMALVNAFGAAVQPDAVWGASPLVPTEGPLPSPWPPYAGRAAWSLEWLPPSGPNPQAWVHHGAVAGDGVRVDAEWVLTRICPLLAGSPQPRS